MKILFHHINQVKEKPHHVRRRVAFAAALSCTGLIALVWFIGTVSAGVFALEGSSFADSQNRPAEVAATPGASGLAGVAGALPPERQPAHIEIVDAKPAPSTPRQPEATVLPF